MVKQKKTTSTKLRKHLQPVSAHIDVRDENEVMNFESVLKRGPITFVLVYADYCGHCTTYKDQVWNKLTNVEGRKNQIASVHYDQLGKTSLKNAKIDGYPSVLVVGTDKKPANFNSNEGNMTNAMPDSRNVELLTSLLKKDAAGDEEEEEETTPYNNSDLSLQENDNLLENLNENINLGENANNNSDLSLKENANNNSLLSLQGTANQNANQNENVNLVNSLGNVNEPPNPDDDLVNSQSQNNANTLQHNNEQKETLLNSLNSIANNPSLLKKMSGGKRQTKRKLKSRRRSTKRR